MLCITQRERVRCGSGWDARRSLRPIARAIGNKCNAADRPRPRQHRPRGVMQSILEYIHVISNITENKA